MTNDCNQVMPAVQRVLRRFGRALATIGVATLLASPAMANQTTASIRGVVLGPNGTGDAGASVRIVDERTGTVRSTSTAANGVFVATGLRVGGPYRITIDSSRNSDRAVSDIYLTVGETYNLNIELATRQLEELVVTAKALDSAAVAVGPSTSFSLDDLETAPAINRDIKDLIRIDPRMYVDEAFVDSVQCGGANPRFNSLTLDGVRMNDNFGLNSNGYPTERMPFSYDSIQQVAVELAPYDVQFGGFSACNINAVTKSGTNEFHGSVFFDYNSDSLNGDELEGSPIDLGSFTEERYGFAVGGPIVKDKLFFYLTYEYLEGARIHDRGPVGSGAGREIQGVSQADFNTIRDTLNNLYNYDPGSLPSSSPVEDEKYSVKLDWNINDSNRAAFTYLYNDGYNISESDSDSNELEFSNHYYERGAEINSYSFQLFSDWSDTFSTEVRVAYSELLNRQLSLGGTEFGEFQITTLNDPDGDGTFSRATVYAGADDSRHANKLNHDNLAYKLAFSWSVGDHLITGGYEREDLDVFNLFIQEAEGEFRFGSVADLIAGTPSRVIYENAAPTNNPDDAAASFNYVINSIYLQDEYNFSDVDLTIVAGVRYDWYQSDDVPNANPNFAARYGYSNSQNVDGKDLIQPRAAFEWGAAPNLNIRGGIGIFSGGNPNVWLSNNYSNNGITQVEQSLFSLDGAPDTLFNIATAGGGRPGYDIPQVLVDAIASGTADSGVNVLDPNFEIPSSLKLSLGGTYYFDMPGSFMDGFALNADWLYSESRDSAVITDLTLAQTGTAPDGRPIYRGVDRSDADCVDPTAAACSGRSQDFALTNVQGSDGSQQVFSFSFDKDWDNGVSLSLGYAYTESEDVNPMTSSVAFSNFANIAVSDPNDPGVANSNYLIPHRLTLKLSYDWELIDGYPTRITLFGSRNQGRPYSYSYTSGFMFGDSVGFIDRPLLYIPTGASDPNVTFGAGFNQNAFFDFVQTSGLGEYAGGIAPRNAFFSAYWTKFDLRLEQQLPGFMDGHHSSLFVVVENLGNLIRDDWGVLYESSFPRYQSVVDASIDGSGNYVYNEFFSPTSQSRATDASLWEVRIGLRYDF